MFGNMPRTAQVWVLEQGVESRPLAPERGLTPCGLAAVWALVQVPRIATECR